MLLNIPSEDFAYICLFVVSFSALVLQALVKQKRQIHFLFALFCASLCMMTVQKVSASSLGVYQYLIGFATCATCNVVWLISRSLFREKDAVNKRHIFVALLIACLIIANQAWHFINSVSVSAAAPSALMVFIKESLSEITNLLSSTILLLSFWEALRGFSSKSTSEKQQRVLFASAFFIAVCSSIIMVDVVLTNAQQIALAPWVTLFAASIVILAIQLVMILQQQEKVTVNSSKLSTSSSQQKYFNQTPINQPTTKRALNVSKNATQSMEVKKFTHEDELIIAGINKLVYEDKIYLQSNIKLLDFAKAINASEYKVSKLVRQHFNSPNFNHFINRHRVEHAKSLLQSPESKTWSILVIALESGFSSLVSFNRTFKTLSGDNPSKYRALSLESDVT